METVIETDRLQLREITDDDVTDLHRIYSDPECMQHYPSVKTWEETRQWFEELAVRSYSLHGFGLWAVVERETNVVIGDCGLTLQTTPLGREPEIGYHLRKEYWGKGYATEAAAACRDLALGDLKFPRVVSIVSPENVSSQRVAERIHQRRELYRKMSLRSGQEVTRYLYISERSPA